MSHYLYFVKTEGKDKKEAVKRAKNALDDNSFCSQGGYFAGGKCDWYVVGGRWSGEFFMKTPEYQKGIEALKQLDFIKKEIKKRPDLLAMLYINEHLVTKQQVKKIDDIFKKVTGMVYFRDCYHSDGYEDDANKITPELLKELRKEKYEDVEVFDAENEEEYLVKDLSKEAIGSWLVTIDYHN